MDFGTYLKTKRLEKGMTIRQVALYAGCSDSYLSMLERGERGCRSPTVTILKKLAKPLGVPIEVLMQAAGYSEEHIESETEHKTIIRIIRDSIGESEGEFAVRIGVSLDDLIMMEKHGASTDSVQLILERVVGCRRFFSANQRSLLVLLERTLSDRDSEKRE